MTRLTVKLCGLIALFYACSSQPSKTTIEIMNDSIKSFIQKNADDPKSYEPVETLQWDTVTFLQNIEKQIKFYERAAESFEEFGEHGRKDREDYLKKVTEFSAMKDSLLNTTNPDAPAAFIVMHRCRLKNKMGGLTLSNMVFEFRPNLTIYHVYEQDKGRSKGYPGGFPNQ